MKNNSKKIILFFVVFTSLFFSCEDLTEVNINKNGVEPSTVNPNLVMPSVLSEAAKAYVNLGYQDIAGVVQHTQKDAWSSGHNDYDWGGSQDWSGYYAILRDNDLFYKRSVEMGLEFHQGVALVMKSFVFGLITDLWGDAPYSKALNAEAGGLDNTRPAYDTQDVIYKGILADLETANTLLSKSKSEYSSIVDEADVFFKGDPAAWRRFANSLMLRYYMRISDREPTIAKAGIEKIVANASQYPVITTNAQDATMTFPGTSSGTAWPATTVFDPSESNYKRIKMCATLVESLQAKKDPRLSVWAKKVQIPLMIDPSRPAGYDKVEADGIRHLAPDVVGTNAIDTDPEYVGMPPSFSQLPSTYNFNPTPGQTSNNPHVSFLNDLYKKASDNLLRARLISTAEVEFILAEAALKGWSAGSAQTHYENGVKASLTTWGKSADYATYIAGANVAYNGTLDQIIEQKWIASWTAATEAWFDFRRTGLPALKAGPVAKRKVLPVRFYYSQDELKFNQDNTLTATDKLEITNYSQSDGKNSPWSKPWLIQGTGKPW